MNDLNTALYARMDGDTGTGGVRTLAPGGIHYGVAPQDKATPYVIFQKQAGTQEYTFGMRAFDHLLYLVKAVAADSASEGGRKTAGTIAERIDALLTDGVLFVTGKIVLAIRKMSDVDYIDRDPATGKAFYHVGCLFRIEVADADSLLLESGGALLLESGDRMLLE